MNTRVNMAQVVSFASTSVYLFFPSSVFFALYVEASSTHDKATRDDNDATKAFFFS